MIAVLAQRPSRLVPVAALAAAVFGALAARAPLLAIGVVGLALLLVFAFRHPVAHLWVLLVVTGIVPYGLQNAYGIGGGAGQAGLLVSDVLLLVGVVRAVAALSVQRLARGTLAAAGLAVVLLAIFTLQMAHGLLGGSDLSGAGNEFRILLGFGGTLLVALPILIDEAARPRLLGGLLLAGLVLGLWGIAQWTLDLSFSYEGGADVGVREGVDLTTTGRGSLQGGLYGYPVAVILAFAALLSGARMSAWTRLAVVAVLTLNAIGCLLTFERTFWVVTLLGCGVVALRSGHLQRAKALVAAPAFLAVGLVAMYVLSPATLTTAQQRFLSIGQYGNDPSVSYRLLEARYTVAEIRARPVTGSGLGATIFWGRPAEQVRAEEEFFVHNGYLWLAWKLGIPAALLLYGAVALGIVRPGRARGTPAWAGAVRGAQAALLALMIASVTFPAFTTLAITPTLAVALGLCAMPRLAPTAAPRRSALVA